MADIKDKPQSQSPSALFGTHSDKQALRNLLERTFPMQIFATAMENAKKEFIRHATPKLGYHYVWVEYAGGKIQQLVVLAHENDVFDIMLRIGLEAPLGCKYVKLIEYKLDNSAQFFTKPTTMH